MKSVLSTGLCGSALTLLGAVTSMLLASAFCHAEEAPILGKGHWQLNGLAEGARIHNEGMPFWQLVGGNDKIRAGSSVEIPGQGGLIRPEIGAVTAQSTSRFEVPSSGDGKSLEHVSGNARYHISNSLTERFFIETPQLRLSTSGSVFDIEADALGTQVEVADGVVLVETFDGNSDVRLRSGQSARVSSVNLSKLEFRSQAGSRFAATDARRGRDSSSERASSVEDEPSLASAESGTSTKSEDADSNPGSSSADPGPDKGNSSQASKGKGVEGSDKDAGDGKGKDSGRSQDKNTDKGKDKDRDRGKDRGKGGDKGKGGGKGKGKGRK